MSVMFLRNSSIMVSFTSFSTCGYYVLAPIRWSSHGSKNELTIKGTFKKQRQQVPKEGTNSSLRKEYLQEKRSIRHFDEGLESLEHSILSDGYKRDTANTLTRVHSAQRLKVKRLILQKKYFRSPFEESILTWRAKEQFFHLATLSEHPWDAQSLSAALPVSAVGAEKLLRNSSSHMSKSFAHVIIYNDLVIRRWKLIQGALDKLVITDKGSIRGLQSLLPVGLQWLVTPDLFKLLPFANGNPNLPFPTLSKIEQQLNQETQRQHGPFEAMALKFDPNSRKPSSVKELHCNSKYVNQLTEIDTLTAWFQKLLLPTSTESKSPEKATTAPVDFLRFLLSRPNSVMFEATKKKPVCLPDRVKLDFTVKCNKDRST